jgi:hypothetical protein
MAIEESAEGVRIVQRATNRGRVGSRFEKFVPHRYQ